LKATKTVFIPLMHVLFSNIFANASRKRKCFSLIFKIPGEADLSNTVITRPKSFFYCFFSNGITENNELTDSAAESWK
jgi:hypothetical protein